MKMKCAALTGISPEVIKELKGGKPRTIELQSTHNIVSIAGVKPGPDSHIFMTSVDLEDLEPGDQGICVIVVATSVSMKRMVEFSHGLYYEERERISARIQVKYCALSVVKQVFREGVFGPTTVEVLKSSCYHAG
jgi:uncharacterized protein